MIVKLRSIADSLEEVMNELNSISVPPSGHREVPLDEQGLGKSVIAMSGTPLKLPNYQLFETEWKSANDIQAEARLNRKKAHWTQLPENKKKLTKAIKAMSKARRKR